MDGGYTWEAVTTTTNSGLNSLAVLDENNFFVAGEINSGTAALIKVQPQA
jgi:transketolase N-terminal domain/subunit